MTDHHNWVHNLWATDGSKEVGLGRSTRLLKKFKSQVKSPKSPRPPPLLFLQSVFRSIGGRDPSLPHASPPFQCTWVYHLRYVIFHFYCYCNVLIFSWMWKPTGIRVHSCLKHLSLTYLIWSPRIACQQSWHSPIYVSGASVDSGHTIVLINTIQSTPGQLSIDFRLSANWDVNNWLLVY